MLRCWHPDSKMRPSFDELAEKVKEIIATMEQFEELTDNTGVTYSAIQPHYLCPRTLNVGAQSGIEPDSTECLTLGASSRSTIV